jgi:hypothetical protein
MRSSASRPLPPCSQSTITVTRAEQKTLLPRTINSSPLVSCILLHRLSSCVELADQPSNADSTLSDIADCPIGEKPSPGTHKRPAYRRRTTVISLTIRKLSIRLAPYPPPASQQDSRRTLAGLSRHRLRHSTLDSRRPSHRWNRPPSVDNRTLIALTNGADTARSVYRCRPRLACSAQSSGCEHHKGTSAANKPPARRVQLGGSRPSRNHNKPPSPTTVLYGSVISSVRRPAIQHPTGQRRALVVPTSRSRCCNRRAEIHHAGYRRTPPLARACAATVRGVDGHQRRKGCSSAACFTSLDSAVLISHSN